MNMLSIFSGEGSVYKKFLQSLFLISIFSSFFSLTAQTPKYRLCVRVVDGDTIVLDGNETVRLIGVDTPETKDPRRAVHYSGAEASAFTQKLVEGKSVRLEYDQEQKDKYGRTLAYIYLEDGTFVNAEIIKQGIGFAYIKYPFKYLDQFYAMEREARIKEIGFWSHDDSAAPISPLPSEPTAQGAGIQPKTKTTKSSAQDSSNSQNAEVTVYVTRSGAKYHTANCRYAKTASPMSLKDAVARGLAPCSLCKPPTIKDGTSSELGNSTPSAPIAKNKTSASSPPSGFMDRTIYTSPRGGKYYINSKRK
jgi:endonuclease YncB( thermonuclease family)